MRDTATTAECKVPGIGYRHQQCCILFFNLLIAYSVRSCMGVALVAMTTTQTNSTAANTTDAHQQPIDQDNETEGFLHALMFVSPYPTFHWSKRVQDGIISSFFWGYMLLQIPGGMLAHRFGVRILLAIDMTINCIVFILFPWIAHFGGWTAVVICRVLQGLSQASIFPALHTFFGKWAPLRERGRLTASVYGGQCLGTVAGLILAGFLASSPLGWPSIFRLFGVFAGIQAVVIWTVLADSPAQHHKISDSERRYIETGLGQTAGGAQKNLPVPWKSILTSAGMWAIIAGHVGNGWGHIILYMEVPSFMDKIMGVNIKNNGLLTALPFLCQWFTNYVHSFVVDFLINRKICSVTTTRKLAQAYGSLSCGIGIILLTYVPRNIYIVESLLVLMLSMNIATHMGYQLNHIDISPNFAGTMMGISNFLANLGASISPLVAGFILTDASDIFLWRHVFFIGAGFYFVSTVIYIVLGTAQRAEWNEPIKPVKETEPMIS